jgi:hypothetical protein
MISYPCPKCNEYNLSNALYCGNCGGNLVQNTQKPNIQTEVPKVYQRQYPEGSKPQTITNSYSSHRYSALRGIASLCNGLAIATVIIAGLIGLGGLFTMADSFLLGMGVILIAAINCGLVYVILKVLSESIFVILDIESNTARSANGLETFLKNR